MRRFFFSAIVVALSAACSPETEDRAGAVESDSSATTAAAAGSALVGSEAAVRDRGGVDAGVHWPGWRGPHLDGSAEASGLPVRWSETENIVWKVALPSWSGSTPAIWGDRIFVASPIKKRRLTSSRRARDPGGRAIRLYCLDKSNGKVLWDREIGKRNELQQKQNMSSPSPSTDGRHVWAMTGKGDLVAFDFEGKELWRRDITKDHGKFGLNFGFGSSPLLFEDRLIIAVLHGFKTDDPSYLLALDKLTGKTLWKTIRPTDGIQESPDSYATPTMAFPESGPEIVMNGGDVVTGHDPADGKELWRAGGLNPGNSPWYRTIASCVVVGDIAFVPTRERPLLAVRTGGRGDVTDSHVLWGIHGPDVPTPVADSRYLWTLGDRGIVTCWDAGTGNPVWGPQRIETGTYSASLVRAEGKIYATSESAVTTVFSDGEKFEQLAVNRLDDGYTLSSIAISENRIYLRTSTHLYCIGE